MTTQDHSIPGRRLAEVLQSHATLKLATSTPSGEPWIAAAYFAQPHPFSLIVMLEQSGRTLRNLETNTHVAIMLEDGNPMAVFAQGRGEAKIVEGAAASFQREIVDKTPDSAPLMGLPGLVPVRIDVAAWKLTDVPNGWLPARELKPAP